KPPSQRWGRPPGKPDASPGPTRLRRRSHSSSRTIAVSSPDPASSAMAAIRFSLFLLALALAACKSEPETQNAVAAAGNCRAQNFEGSRFTACRYDARRHRLELAEEDGAGPLRSFERLRGHLGPRAGRLLFAMN